MAIDPVCGMAIDENGADVVCEHDGATYLFCSAECRDKFVADPSQYVDAFSSADSHPRKRTNVDRATAYFRIWGMQSMECAGRIESALDQHDGVLVHAVNLSLEEAVVEYDAAVTNETDLLAVIKQAGYVARSAAGGPSDIRHSRQRLLQISVGVVLSVLAIVADSVLSDPMRIRVLLPIALVVHAYVGIGFYVGAVGSLLRGRLSADLLVVLGAGALLVYSVVTALTGGTVYYFHTSAIVVTIVAFGRWMEQALAQRTADTVRRFLELQPDHASVIRDGHEQRVPLSSVVVGDIVVVRPGASVPTDGVVEEGHSTVDESAITGTRMPSRKIVGSQVWAGSINREGVFRYRVVRVGADTVLRQITHFIQQTQESETPAGGYPAGPAAKAFLPAILAVAAATAAIWIWAVGAPPDTALIHAVAVLLAAGPAAMRIAERAALMEGIGLSMERGVLVRDMKTLDNMRLATCIVFDRSSGISKDVPEMTDIVPAAGNDSDSVLFLAARVEQENHHPAALTLQRIVEHRDLDIGSPVECEWVDGLGSTAQVDGDLTLVGTSKLMDMHGISFARLQHEIDRLKKENKFIIYVARNGKPVGLLAFSYVLHPLAAQTVAAFKRMGLYTVMVTDGTGSAMKVVGQTAGVDEVFDGIGRDQKPDVVRDLRERGYKVIFVGNGILDAQAINEADLGVALGSGTEVAAQMGQVVLVGKDLDTVVYAISLGRRTIRKTRQNLAAATLYNIVAVLIAATGFISPATAAAASAAASVAIAANTLLLRHAIFVKNIAITRS